VERNNASGGSLGGRTGSAEGMLRGHEPATSPAARERAIIELLGQAFVEGRFLADLLRPPAQAAPRGARSRFERIRDWIAHRLFTRRPSPDEVLRNETVERLWALMEAAHNLPFTLNTGGGSVPPDGFVLACMQEYERRWAGSAPRSGFIDSLRRRRHHLIPNG
jgi:hypothetical protein